MVQTIFIKTTACCKELICLGLFLFSANILAQGKKLDSLENRIRQHTARDTARVRLILDYSLTALNDDTSKLLPYLNEALRISKQQKFRRGLQSAYVNLQVYYSDRGDVEKAKRYADTAFTVLKNDKNRNAIIDLAWLHNNVAGDYAKLADYQQAINQLQKTAVLFEKYNPDGLAAVYGNIALMYSYLLLPQRAMEYDRKAIVVAEKSGNILSIARRKLNYTARLIDQKNFNEAERILNDVEPLVRKANNNSTYIFFYQSKGLVDQSKKQYDSAIDYLMKAYGYTVKNDDKLNQVNILEPLTATLLASGNSKEAKKYLDELLALSLTYKIRTGELNAYKSLAQWHQQQQDYKMANSFHLKSIRLSDSLSSEDMKEKIATMETRFRVEGKDKEIRILQDEKKIQQLSLRQKSTLNIILIGGSLALFIIFLLLYRNYSHRQKLQQQRISELETEKQLAAAEAVFKGEEQERARLAKDLHDGLGGMLSGIKHSFTNMKENLIMTPDNALAFGRGIDLLDSSIREMRRVAHNMMPEILMQFGLDTALKEFCIELGRNGTLTATYQPIDMDAIVFEPNLSVTAYRVVQELSNNALKHAGATTLLVQAHASKEDGLLQLTVEDNGIGFDPSVLEQSGGMGWKNIRNRVELLKGKIDINTAHNKGTSVLIEIPLS